MATKPTLRFLREKRILEECCEILWDIEKKKFEKTNELYSKKEYFDRIEKKYLKYKSSKQNEDMFSYYEYVVLTAIRTMQNNNLYFVFRYPKLSFQIMINNEEDQINNDNDTLNSNPSPMIYQNTIREKQFEQWAPSLYPLASKNNVQKIFGILAKLSASMAPSSSKQSKNNENQQNYNENDISISFEEQQTNSNATSPRKASFAKLKDKYLPSTVQSEKKSMNFIHLDEFLLYVNELKNQFDIENLKCPNIRATLENNLQKYERIIVYKKGATEPGLPPFCGFIVLTDYHLIFHGTGIGSKTTVCDLNTVQKVEKAKIGLISHDVGLKVCTPQQEYTWSIVSVKSESRDRLLSSILTMVEAYKLISAYQVDNNIDTIKRQILRETADDILRTNALQNICNFNVENNDNISFLRTANDDEKAKYMQNIKLQIENIQSKITWLSSIKSVVSGEGTAKEDRNAILDPSIDMKTYEEIKNPIDDEYNENFDPRTFVHHLKVFRSEIDPLIITMKFYQCIIEWRNPGVSLTIMFILLLISYMNYIHYIPGIILILNAIFMMILRHDETRMMQLIEDALLYCGYNSNEDMDDEDNNNDRNSNLPNGYHDHIHNTNDNKNDNSGSNCNNNNDNTNNNGNEESNSNIFTKISNIKKTIKKTKISLDEAQTKISKLNTFLGRIRALYRWRIEEKSQQICLISLGIGVTLWLLPLKLIFAGIVFGIFMKHSPFKRHNKKKDLIDKFIESVPPDIPEDEDDKENKDS